MIIHNCEQKIIKGELQVPGDKSISHRAVMLGSIANGTTVVKGFLMGDDCLNTIACFKEMGIDIEVGDDNRVIIHGKGLKGLKAPAGPLYVGNSGTTIRLLSGILAGQPFEVTITGDQSIKRRPMGRVIEPLRLMGARISGEGGDNFAPLTIKGGKLKGITYKSPIASAQVKSAILLASLYADGQTVIEEPYKSRDHTETMINYFGGMVKVEGNKIISKPVDRIEGREIWVPGDISSAAFFIVAALILDGSELIIRNVGINPTRTGIIEVLQEMGGRIEVINKRMVCNEPVADIRVCSSPLKGTVIGGEMVPRMIDEIPVLAVAALFASGKTYINDAHELKVKESNRLTAICSELRKMGGDVREKEDGLIIYGDNKLKLEGAVVDSYNDHRIAMSLAVAALKACGKTEIIGFDCVDISFPGFYDVMMKVLNVANSGSL